MSETKPPTTLLAGDDLCGLPLTEGPNPALVCALAAGHGGRCEPVDPSRLPGGGDLSRVVAELPGDAIEAAKVAVMCAARAAYLPLDQAAAVAVAAAEPVIAAHVRAEALREAAEKIAPNQVRPSNVIVVGARMTDDVLDMVRTVEDALVAAVRAQAEADERRRMLDGANPARAQAMREVENYVGPNLAGWPAFPGVYFGGLVDRVISAYAVAAGSVPVATPQATCASWVSSNHDDEDVSRCGGQSVGEWFSTSGQWQPVCARHSEGVPSDRLRAIQVGPAATSGPMRFKDTLPIEVHEATAVAYVRLSDAPVARTCEHVKDAVLVDYGRDGYPVGVEIHFAAPVATPPAESAAEQLLRDIFMAPDARPRRYDQCDGTCTVDCGHCKGQGRPVATPTEPPASPVSAEQPARPEPDLLTALQRSLDRARAGRPAGDGEAFDRRAGEEEAQAELLGHRLTVGDAVPAPLAGHPEVW